MMYCCTENGASLHEGNIISRQYKVYIACEHKKPDRIIHVQYIHTIVAATKIITQYNNNIML